ncbi:MAG: hypothetical protein JWQ27_2181 [Ferruginibacter sp.]|nr:hypothetical protein [Ferruginibacter sp.]
MQQFSFRYKLTAVLFFLLFCLKGWSQTDTSRRIDILDGQSLRQLTIDSNTVLKTIAGNAIVRQGRTILSGDSIALNQLTGVAEVFGHVHINDADSVHTYANYLRYIGKERIAYLKRNVKLTDGKGILYTDDLEYNLATGIATYKNGGRVVNGKTVLTSSDAVYYSDTKDVYFKKYVHLTDPKYDIVADSLLYNTQTKEAHFISPTRIKTKDGIINTKNGVYNLETGESTFYDRTSIVDSTRSITGNYIFFDDKKGIALVEGNGKIVDSVSKVIVLGDRLEMNTKENSFLGTRKPIMIIYRNNDSTYITADTLFSGLRKYDSSTRRTVIKNDTLNKVTELNVKTSATDSIRYFLGYHNVRIFNDSIQAVSDSMYYSTEDSVFRLFKDPVFWNAQTQVNGDTMYLFTQNQKPKRLYVFNNSMVINKANDAMFNQMSGRTLNGYFKDGEIDYIRMKGSPAESVFYPQDEDSAYIGMNRSKGDVIDIFFVKKELNKVKFVNNVDGTLFPLRQVPADQKYLKGFNWMDSRRPKTKLQMFE